ncbi:MAG: ATP-binding cassette domain-containing protein [Anaerolineaceae bacterium]|nr:ATP-binding cassette domain-containing protein [Anaerolineaceae bacterium]
MKERKPIIEIKGLTFTYSGKGVAKPALKGINLTIYEGEYVALMGLNGAGKTTLELCLNGVIPNMIVGDYEGEVIVEGKDTYDTPVREMAKSVGMVFDNPAFQISQMFVAEEIALGMESLGISSEIMHSRVPEVLEIVGLAGLEERSPFGLSGGQQQRLAIASALAMEPNILVMDEPTSNVDPIGKEEIFAVAEDLNKKRGMTVIMAEHEVEVIAAYADRVVVLEDGEVILNGTPHEVFSNIEEFHRLGLRLPQVTEFAYQLEKEGITKFDKYYPVTVDEAVEVFKKRGITL